MEFKENNLKVKIVQPNPELFCLGHHTCSPICSQLHTISLHCTVCTCMNGCRYCVDILTCISKISWMAYAMGYRLYFNKVKSS